METYIKLRACIHTYEDLRQRTNVVEAFFEDCLTLLPIVKFEARVGGHLFLETGFEKKYRTGIWPTIWEDVRNLRCSFVAIVLRDADGHEVAQASADLFGVMAHTELIRFLNAKLPRLYVDSKALKVLDFGVVSSVFGGAFPKDFSSSVLSLVKRVFAQTNGRYAFVETLSSGSQDAPDTYLDTDYEIHNNIYWGLWEEQAG